MYNLTNARFSSNTSANEDEAPRSTTTVLNGNENLSFPSPRITIANVPEVARSNATFVYNFFVNDESLNDSGDVNRKFKELPAESFDASILDEARRHIPRYVKIEFNPVTLYKGGLGGNEFIQRQNPAGKLNEIAIKDHLQDIQSESSFSTVNFTGIEFNDNNIDRKLYTIVSGTIAKRIVAKNRELGQQIDESKQTVISNLFDERSLMDAAKALVEETSENVSDAMIVKSLAQIDELSTKFINNDAQKQIIDRTFSKLKNISIQAQINNRIIGTVVKNVINDPMNLYSDELKNTFYDSAKIQQLSIANSHASQISSDEFEPVFRALSLSKLTTSDYIAKTMILGYVIEKSELMRDGTMKTHPPIVIENANASSAIDLNVAYGRTYVYTIKTIAQISVKSSVENSSNLAIATGLVSSRKSTKMIVDCIEKVPPPYPADFNVVWNYTLDCPVIMWSFPPTSQRDIKKFQVFKRNTINDPFELIKQYDFDDSIVKLQNNETPDVRLIEKLEYPSTSYADRSFQKNHTAIYAVCCIDAHGLSSNYSTQLQVSFDHFKNIVRKNVVSFADAPKPYPNMLLNTDLFIDTIKTSGYTRIKVVFDPEYLNVTDAKNVDLNLLQLSNTNDSKYRLQIINTDIMEQEIVDIKINDMRRTASTRTIINRKL